MAPFVRLRLPCLTVTDNIMPCSQLGAPQMPAKDLYKALWRTQERVPLVHLYGQCWWVADTFLAHYAPYPKSVSGLRPKV